MCPLMFTPSEIARFQRDGFIIVRSLAAPALCDAMTRFTQQALAAEAGPVEFEADVHYPGAPATLDAPGGRTVRRLLQAYSRHALFQRWATGPAIASRIQQLLDTHVVMPQAHHNCILTKQPQFSSATLWHQDIRFWSFQRPELVSVWTALGAETVENGCLQLLPGTHTMHFQPDQLDADQFLHSTARQNQTLLATRVNAELQQGDVLFFHCRTFHAAQRNQTQRPKFSLVFTYRPADNLPIAGTRSALIAEIALDDVITTQDTLVNSFKLQNTGT